jgi:polyisoprenoid-binding protein YceI
MRFVAPVCLFFALAACSPQNQKAGNDAPAAPPVTPAAAAVPAGAYTLDKAHASLIFRVDHLGFSHFTARFTRFTAQLQFDPAHYAASSVTVTIDPRSIESDNPPAGFMDMLSGPQWLDAAAFPEITFRSTRVEPTGSRTMRVTGDFSLHGVTRPVILDVAFNGGYAGHPMDPHARIGFSSHGSLTRSDFGIAFGVPAPGSKMGVSDDVEVIIEAEFSGPPWNGPTRAQ